MARLFVFGIGGTGARVMKSLTMLLASGMKPGNFEVVPILIDPHKDLKELNDCKTLLKLYSDINDKTYSGTTNIADGFFRTKVSTLKSLAADSGLKDDFEFDERHDLPFGQFLELTNLNSESPTHDLLSLLYSEENFHKPLSVGFKGNPNVGSVVLNSLKDGPGFKAFESVFGNGDRIFIISSIFGGTGAAGFPLLLKNFRNHSKTSIKQGQIGALAVMPYFKLTDTGDASDIDSNNFMTKTKAALTYYVRPEFSNLCEALYYIADPDKQNKPYENNEREQPNKAHLVELLGALAIFNFANTNFTTRGEVYEYCLKSENASVVDFTNIADETRGILGKKLINFYMLTKLHPVNQSKPNLPFNKIYNFNQTFEKDKTFFDDLHSFFTKYFLKWMRELAENERKLKPLNISDSDDFNGLINGYITERKYWDGKFSIPFNLSQIHLEMSKASAKKELRMLKEVNSICQYLSICHYAINEVVNSKINF